ncbi:Piso0_000305 [Millerozyma farinosa CBS 7064]|uniref:Piso0_000305 protein n=1 Tax=Pichia sorbitophila (strain ATCC MYA-4447 / BCRC 22081 / CBS 7064 / NBRC 10061 / NRRL Y-12695) TaxID=559304 RepID=G8YTM3_PICSO|nr:Piso0_000305 [Millerozyma farinosa CBS 7064]
MAPPTPVYRRSDIFRKYGEQLNDPQKYDCELKSIVQHECTFKLSQESDKSPDIICLPFKRVFQKCLKEPKKALQGKETQDNDWITIEVTDSNTNRNFFKNTQNSTIINEFLNTDKELQRFMESEADGNV